MIRAPAFGTGTRLSTAYEYFSSRSPARPLRAAVQLRAREPRREVAPVVGRERTRQVVRAGSDGGAAGGDHGRPRLENPPVARRCPGLDERDRVGCALPEQPGGPGHVCELSEHVRDDDELSRAGAPSRRPRSPSERRAAAPGPPRPSPARSRRGSAPPATAMPRRAAHAAYAGPGSDVEQRARPPIGSLDRYLPEDRRRRRIGLRRPVGEVGGDGGASARCTRRCSPRYSTRTAARPRRRPPHRHARPAARLPRPSCGGSAIAPPRTPARPARRRRGCPASRSRSSLATLPSASITKVERSMPMYVLPPYVFSPQTP